MQGNDKYLNALHFEIEGAEASARNYAGRVRQVLEEIRVAITDGDEQEALNLIAEALGEEPADADE